MSPSGDVTLTLEGNQASSGKSRSGFLSTSISTSLPSEVGQHTENFVFCKEAKKAAVREALRCLQTHEQWEVQWQRASTDLLEVNQRHWIQRLDVADSYKKWLKKFVYNTEHILLLNYKHQIWTVAFASIDRMARQQFFSSDTSFKINKLYITMHLPEL